MDMRELPGAGAAGNLSAGLEAFPGTDLVAMTADRIDSQTAFGKVPAGVGSALTRSACLASPSPMVRAVELGSRGKEKSRAFFERGKVGPTTVVYYSLHYSIIID